MPPFIQPQTLYSLSLFCVNQVVNGSCDAIHKFYGDYDQPECKAQVKSLQTFFLSNIPSVLMDEIAEDRKLSVDARVKLALLMHPAMRKFSAAMTWECRVALDDFWIAHFAELHKLVSLNLYLACTDEILYVVSENCPLLEDINIVSKVENCQNQTAGNFNALRLQLFVSDVGLGHLVKCQKLKRITTNKTLRSYCGGRMMTHTGLRALVKGLPNLEALRYEDLGTVIASEMNDVSQLALSHLCDNHPSRQNVEAAARLCPQLTHYRLCMPYIETASVATDHLLEDGIATTLADSTIVPTILELIHFYFSDAVSNLLKIKGSVLTSLFLYPVNVIGVTELLMIGEVCLSLENLHIKRLGSNIVQENVHIKRLGSNIVQDSVKKWISRVSIGVPLFKRLKCLYLSGKKWKPGEILDLFMMTACGLTSLSVWNVSSVMSMNPTSLDDFIMKHQFPELQSANFSPGCPLSIDGLQSFVYKCPKLTHVMVYEHDMLKPHNVQPLQDELVNRNLNIKIILQETW